MTPSFEWNPLKQGHEILSQKTRVLGAARGEDFVIVACTVFVTIQQRDRQTDRRTDAHGMAKTREAF